MGKRVKRKTKAKAKRKVSKQADKEVRLIAIEMGLSGLEQRIKKLEQQWSATLERCNHLIETYQQRADGDQSAAPGAN